LDNSNSVENPKKASTARVNGSAFHISAVAAAQGIEIEKVNVGSSPVKRLNQTFNIHKALLCKASPYFHNVLTNGFKETNSEPSLPEDNPMAFEVLYQWLSFDKVLEAHAYTGGVTTNENLWLRVFKMANCHLVDELKKTVYKRLRSVFGEPYGLPV
jgi:BTB/POZ domain